MIQEAATDVIKAGMPEGYVPVLDFFETQKAIKLVKDTFERKLSKKLGLIRVSAPRFLESGSGLQDDLAGTQIPVSFRTKFSKREIEVVHSLAKWKRYALGRYGFKEGCGLYTDMDAIRKDEAVDETHSIYVDQWDWELVISRQDRSLVFLKGVVRKIYSAIRQTEAAVSRDFHALKPWLPRRITFLHAEEMEAICPGMAPREREGFFAEKYGAIFIIGIGHPMRSGLPHDLRAADYDDWSAVTGERTRGLNGDIIVWDHVRKRSLELSSMGIRVDKDSMLFQLGMMGLHDRKTLEFHRKVISQEMPLTIGGGIGQSRLCMLLLQKAHIGEVQSSVWPDPVKDEFDRRKIPLL
ncbi:MAG: aspartate--ammonia ligase [archaeon]